MSAGEQNDSEAAISIAEAARRLNVSERTIYRMLHSGKIHRVNLSDKVVKVKLLDASNSINEINQVAKSMNNTVDASGKMSDIMTNLVERELRIRDAQIEQLIASQQEMNKTIQRMQDQVFELACLVVKSRTVEDRSDPESQTPKSNGVLAALFRGRKRS